jgi:predicted nucleotidyltransferase component of viral defense system
MINQTYRSQVQLLLLILPYVAVEKDLALKGGTAINMFVWNMPRLSVDLDLTYTGFEDRDIALTNIAESLLRIKARIIKNITGIQVEVKKSSVDQEEKLICKHQNTQVKIEINTIMRGIIKPTPILPVAQDVQKEFGLFADMSIVSQGELFRGKVCAALDRQHPRDLFDIYCLLEAGGITEEIKHGFIMALLSHPRAIHEMLQPNFHNQEIVFINQFQGMTIKPFTYKDFEDTRRTLVTTIHNLLTDEDKEFLLSFKSGTPKWELSGIDNLQVLPAIKWKLLNIQN